MSRPESVFVEYRDKRLTLRQLAKVASLKYETVTHRYYRQKLRGPELWAPSKRPRAHCD